MAIQCEIKYNAWPETRQNHDKPAENIIFGGDPIQLSNINVTLDAQNAFPRHCAGYQ